MHWDDPYRLTRQLVEPLARCVPSAVKFSEPKGLAYGFVYGAFQTTCELTCFGQVVNYAFTAGKPTRDLRKVYRTWPKNLCGLIPYYTMTRAMQFGFPDVPLRRWWIRAATPVMVLPFEQALTRAVSAYVPSVPRPVCSVYANAAPFLAMELIYEASTALKPSYQKALARVTTDGWARLGAAVVGNAVGYFLNHPASVVNGYMKTHPSASVADAVRAIGAGGLAAFYRGAVHRCVRAAHSALVTQLAGVVFETLFVLPPPPPAAPVKKSRFFSR